MSFSQENCAERQSIVQEVKWRQNIAAEVRSLHHSKSESNRFIAPPGIGSEAIYPI